MNCEADRVLPRLQSRANQGKHQQKPWQEHHRSEQMWPVSVDTHGNMSVSHAETFCPVHSVGRDPRCQQDPTWAHCRGWVVGWPWKSAGDVSRWDASPHSLGRRSPAGCAGGTDPPDFHNSTQGENHTISAHEAALCFLTWHSRSLFRLSLPQTLFWF